jgi:type VI secretion system protein ImpH
MAADRRHPDRSVAERLAAEPYRFDFFQAVSLLERMRPDATSVGDGVDPSREAVHFEAVPSLAFPASEISVVTPPGEPGEPTTMRVEFLSLAGVQGPMPRPFTERLLAVRRRGAAARAFLDIFHHRLTSIFYRARRKRRVGLDGHGPQQSVLAPMLRALAGLGTEAVPGLGVADGATLRYAALLGQRPRSAAGMERMLSTYFRVPVRVRQFVGCWRALEPEDATRLGDGKSALGRGAVLGDRVWDQTGRIRLVIGPLSHAQYLDFLPSGTAMPALRALAKLYLSPEIEVECRLVLRASDTPDAWLPPSDTPDGPVEPRLGWTAWLPTRGPRRANPQVTVRAGSE